MRRHGAIDALSTRAAVHADAEKVHPLLVAERPTRLEHSHHGALGRNPEYPDRLAVTIGNYRRVEHAGRPLELEQESELVLGARRDAPVLREALVPERRELVNTPSLRHVAQRHEGDAAAPCGLVCTLPARDELGGDRDAVVDPAALGLEAGVLEQRVHVARV